MTDRDDHPSFLGPGPKLGCTITFGGGRHQYNMAREVVEPAAIDAPDELGWVGTGTAPEKWPFQVSTQDLRVYSGSRCGGSYSFERTSESGQGSGDQCGAPGGDPLGKEE